MSLDIGLIKSSFESVKPIAVEVVSHFYDTLFSSFPESKPLFENVDMDMQKNVLIASLVRVVDGLENLDSLGAYLRSLGGRHVDYGVEEKHYAMVGQTLIGTFRHFFKESWTPELEDQWILAIGFIADHMLEGAKQASKKVVKEAGPRPAPSALHGMTPIDNVSRKPETHDLSHVARQIARSILFKALEDEMDGEFMRVARKKASNVLAQAIREEGDLLQSKFDSSKKRIA